jgi:hypothetical protein
MALRFLRARSLEVRQSSFPDLRNEVAPALEHAEIGHTPFGRILADEHNAIAPV